jgi:hypothetical protein
MESVPNRAPKTSAPDPETSLHEIQHRRGKGSWKTMRSYNGNGLQAARDYSALNIGRGDRKRFVVDGKVVHTTDYNPLGE